MYFLKNVFNACPTQSVPLFLLFGHGSAFPFWLERLMSKAGLQPGNQVSKTKFNQVFFWPVSLGQGQRLESQLPGSPCPLISSELTCTVFSTYLTLYILLCSSGGWACLALLVPTPVAGCQCRPHFCAALPCMV